MYFISQYFCSQRLAYKYYISYYDKWPKNIQKSINLEY